MQFSQIILNSLAKEYNYQTIIAPFSFTFDMGQAYAIKGANGSGKSTLLQCIMRYKKPSQGSVEWRTDSSEIAPNSLTDYFSFAAPYYQLIEEYSLQEMLHIVSQRWSQCIDHELGAELIDAFGMTQAQSQVIKKLSSGQKQKVNLIHALVQHKPVLILDEPTSFLDQDSIEVYSQVIQNLQNRLIIIASNEDRDFIPNSTLLTL